MHTKFEVRTHIVSFIFYIENNFHTIVKIIRINNGVEFSMENIFYSKGIIHQKTK